MAIQLTITDGDLSVSWSDTSDGFGLFRDGWNMPSSQFKSGGIYGNNSLADGQILKHGVFDNVIDSFKMTLHFASIDDLIGQIDDLEELLLRRAPGYWLGERYTSPVWIERRLDSETKTSYSLINQGRVVKPVSLVHPQIAEIQYLEPVTVIVNRRPFWLGAAPGTAQKRPEIYALQDWNPGVVWAEEDTTPAGNVFCFAEIANGDIYAGAVAEILLYDDSADTWAAETTTPISLVGEDVTAALLLSDGDILFGGDGRIIKLSSGTYSEETTLPAGQVWSLAEDSNGWIYAADSGQILRRDSNGTWAADSTLPAGMVYTMLSADSGRMFAGAAGEVLRTDISNVDFSKRVAASSDDAIELSSAMFLTNNWLGISADTTLLNGMRIQNVTIPAGSVITSAVVRFTARNSESAVSGTANIYCEKIADAPTFTTGADNITNRSLTTAYSPWSSISAWIVDTEYDSADFTSALQEVIDQAGWSNSNDVVVVINTTVEGGDRFAKSYDDTPAEAPQLIVTYYDPTWEVCHILASGGDARSSVEHPTNGKIFIGEDGRILVSSNNGDSWGVLSTVPNNDARALIYATGSIFYAADDGNILVSNDGGLSWGVDSTLPTTYGYGMHYSTAGVVRSAESGRVLYFAEATFQTGQEATDTGSVMVANHSKISNITDILNDDGGVFTSIYPASSFPLTLFPGTAAVNDNVYFGTDTSVDDTGPFSSLVFDLSVGASAGTSYAITWEYWNGAWVTLTVQDGTDSFVQVGLNAVVWIQPSGWVTTSINGVTGYWIRARLSALTGAFTNPIQQTRDIYSVNTPYVELDASQTLGTINSLALMEADNKGEGSGGSPALATNRLLMGVKPYDNHELFNAFINFSDEQNQSGITVDESVDGDSATSFQANLNTATGRVIFHDASSSTQDAMADRVKITFSTTVASAYRGTYKAFIRGAQNGGSAGEVKLRLKVISGSGGITYLTDTQATKSLLRELIEFDELINIPVSSQFTDDEVGDETSITLQIETTETDSDYYAYDLFFLPVDNCYVDVTDEANTSSSAVGNGERVTVDNISIPRVLIRAKAEDTATGTIKATYAADSNGAFQMLSQTKQRLWIMAVQTQAAGTDIWRSRLEQVHSVRLWLTDRWLTGRGSV